ncbi:penicillin-binding protein [Jeongeupia sp. HS-3]|uniref:penicillin-binding protein 1C n=1 Tax=Jeongeupia sp. HS-3 TaxID=1009682 RepID=UPI0018A54C0E|nr:penicillin-binding protein 1C [Jeongeupia sp. HS-3]BCL75201.1 penicillin-binding protein [Jeongeupia sp. HS-3]
MAMLAAMPAWALPTFNEVKADWRSSDVMLLDRHGVPVQRVRVDMAQRCGDWVTLGETSPALRHALVVSEDKRFYAHSGVDWSGVAAAAWSNVWNRRTRGASTLTMQLVGLIDEDLRRDQGRRSFWQKAGQSVSAQVLERSWSKAQILEAYLNLVSFRGELVGLSAMSAALFGKLPSGLDARESAIAAALIRAPNASPDRVAERACVILKDMNARDSCGGLRGETQLALARKGVSEAQADSLAPHFARQVLAGAKPGQRVTTTLDAGLQRFATQTLRRHLLELSQRNVQDGAVIVFDNASGDVLAWVGSSGGLSRARDVDAVTAPRQAGSTLKPFLFQLALEGRWLTAASLLDDTPIDLQTASGLYAPQNYAKDFKGPVSVRTALASSLNVPAVRAVEIVTPNRLRERLYALGLTTLSESGDYYGYSLALGAADVRLVDLANAYRALADGGAYSPVRYRPAAKPPVLKAIADPASSFIVADILSDRTARSRTFGLESALATRYWSAVKTGTSKDMRDNWTVGFSRRYTVGVWVGNASGEPMWDISGMHGAAPVWLAVMNRAQQLGGVPQAPRAPLGVVGKQVVFERGVEATRHEWFIKGTVRTQVRVADASDARVMPSRIVNPVDGAIYALDPDIPPASQRIVFRAEGVTGATWWLDGRKLGGGASLGWFPWPGRHVLQLRDGKGAAVGEVRFEVRGATAKQGSKPPA